MAAPQNSYSIYKIRDNGKCYIFKTTIPDFNNASQTQEDDAIETEINSRIKMVNFISSLHDRGEPELLGELQNFPLGEDLYTPTGNKEVNLFYMNTEFGHPWVVMGTADSQEAFLSELSEDEELLALKPIGQPKRITAWFLTEKDLP
jgi:hypothetical protein